MKQVQNMTVPKELGKFDLCMCAIVSVILNNVNSLLAPPPLSRTGQTQSQYLNFGDSQTEGKADAEITRYGSRASVCE